MLARLERIHAHIHIQCTYSARPAFATWSGGDEGTNSWYFNYFLINSGNYVKYVSTFFVFCFFMLLLINILKPIYCE